MSCHSKETKIYAIVISKWLKAIPVFVCLVVLSSCVAPLLAQQPVSGPDQGGGQLSIQGTVVDPEWPRRQRCRDFRDLRFKGKAHRRHQCGRQVHRLRFEAGRLQSCKSPRPALRSRSSRESPSPREIRQLSRFRFEVASVSEEVTVEADDTTSIAAELAPVKSVLDAGSARTEITSNYVSEYTSPVTDFADIIQAAPGTVSYTTNGIGNGQAKIFFRGFVDDDYTMTWDGVPFNDSNDPSHHSWAYVPAAAIGYVDFDRSPGTASDIGPSNFGGSIHFFSPRLSDAGHLHSEITYGSWNTYQVLGDINSGAFLKGKAHFWLNGDYQSSDGYQTNSPKQDVAATAKFDYKFSDRTQFTVIGTNIIVDAFNNNDPTRRQLLHHGDNYLYDQLANASGIFEQRLP